MIAAALCAPCRWLTSYQHVQIDRVLS
eukprot:COSAG03_NODE_26581_length_258_cov_0.704403_1_plen_26_part_10